MANENMNKTNNELAIEFYDVLEKLYKITKDYRFALKTGDECNIKVYSQNLLTEMQNLYWFYEKNHLSSDLANKALVLVNQFNKFVPYFNNFSNSPDRMSTIAQEYAKQAEIEFGILVEMILSYISEIKPTVLRMQEKLIKENLNKQNVFDNNSPINISPHIEVNPQINLTPQIDIIIDISVSIELAKEQAKNSNFDDELLKQVIDKLEELNKIAQEAVHKETRWNKAKKILKWVAEQSLQVASIVVPIIISII